MIQIFDYNVILEVKSTEKILFTKQKYRYY